MNHLNFKTDLDYAKDQDTNDELGHFRSKFHMPEDKNGYSFRYPLFVNLDYLTMVLLLIFCFENIYRKGFLRIYLYPRVI